ncbi:MAG: bifunctional folylpolyglutamate synthase/dihydrofolate synthase [Syntrophales bacterium]|nr:bifunctional folylpolyglutamate synthase/dihydrofolate synthase [Syntrophales bacterium]
MKSKIEQRLETLTKKGINLDLTAIREVLARLNNPQNSYPSVIVGGTNGKGSVCATVATLLRQEGYKVGLYTSPHLVDVRERIRIGEKLISPGDFNRLLDVISEVGGRNLTYFEMLTAMAFEYFKEQTVDIAVLEVGMGGRLDATNVATPLVSVITNVSYDHCEFLGSRLYQIAREKAGIIKEGGICLTGVTHKVAWTEIQRICQERGAQLFTYGRDFRVRRRRAEGTFDYLGLSRRFFRLSFGLVGPHQIKNAACAIGVMEILSHFGFALREISVWKGLMSVRWEGRLERVGSDPLTLLDGAHNPAGVRALIGALQEDYPERRFIFVFGCLADKDYKTMVRLLKPMARIIIFTNPPTARCLPAEEMAILAGENAIVDKDPISAFKKARHYARKNDIVCVTGSLYLVGAIKSYLKSVHNG